MKPEDKERNYERARVLLSEQNFQAAVISGSIATILAAGIYAAIIVVAGYSVSFMAIALGAIVGLTIQFLGRGIESKFVILASVLAVIGCILGNFFAGLILFARQFGESASEIAARVTLDSIIEFTAATFNPADLVYWLIAVAAASYFAKRPLSRADGLAIYTYENRPRGAELVT
jgi:hypothetical protein